VIRQMRERLGQPRERKAAPEVWAAT